jgi:ribosome biogenesis GTPase A
MKHLQWFPGHMTKAMRMMEENVALCDGIIYVLDARCPASSFNKNLKKMFGTKPVLYVLNKSDLADERADLFVKFIKESGSDCVKLNATNSGLRRSLISAVEKMVAEKQAKNAEKGFNKVFRFMVCGIPNTGKSTVINLISGSKRAQTGDKAGVTRGKQWIRCESFELLDTPGTTPPSFDNQTLAVRLAFVGSLNDDILDFDDIALAFLEQLKDKYPARLEERFGITGGTPLEMLEQVCTRRGFILRGGEFDYERGERALIDDFRKGKLGKITLDSIDDCKDYKF